MVYNLDDSPGGESFAIVPSNTVALASRVRGIYVGVAGDITLITPGGNTVLFVGVPQGVILPQTAAYVKTTGTTASSLVGIA